MQTESIGNPLRFYDFLPTPKTAVKAGMGMVAFLAVGAGIVCTLMGKKIIPIDLSNTSNVLIGAGSGLIGFGVLAAGGLGLFPYISQKSKASPLEASPSPATEQKPEGLIFQHITNIDYPNDDVKLATLEAFPDVGDDAFKKLQEIKRKYPHFPILIKDELGTKFARGAQGQLFDATFEGQEIVYKLDNRCSGGNALGFELSYNPRDRMIKSLDKVLNSIPLLDSLKNCSSFPRFLGIIYIKSKNQFGLAFEKIRGITFNDVHFDKGKLPSSLKDRVQIMIDFAQGLKAMDDAGVSHDDMSSGNFMIRTPVSRGVLVDHESCQVYCPESCRRTFGQNLSWVFHQVDLPEIHELVEKCVNDDKSLTWDKIIESLSKTLASQG